MMIAEATWAQIVYEAGTFACWLIAAASFIYLVRKGQRVANKRRQFSLFDLLVVVTFIATLIGLFKGMAGEDEHGAPYKRRGGLSPAELKQVLESKN
jgi:hypothetical protein